MSVLVAGAVRENGKLKVVSIGGGFLLDSKHVVTTSSCCEKTDRGQPKIAIVVQGDTEIGATLVWEGPGYLVILQLDKPLQSAGTTLAPMKLTMQDQPAYTVDFPKNSQPTISETKIQKAFPMENLKVQAYRARPAPDSVYTGGGLFNACGQVMGINIGVKDGVQFAIVIDPVLGGLEKAGVRATIADSQCSGQQSDTGPPPHPPGKEKEKGKSGDGGDGGDEEAPGGWRLPKGGEWVGIGIIVVILAAAMRSGTRQQVARVFTTRRPPVPYPQPQAYTPQPPVPLPRPKKPALHGIAGKYAGASVALETGASLLGRDQATANLVFPPEADSVSKRHCTVRWDAARAVFVLEDLGSTNGTFLSNGERLAPGQPRDLRPGDKFYIGDLRNQFEVRMEE